MGEFVDRKTAKDMAQEARKTQIAKKNNNNINIVAFVNNNENDNNND